MRSKRTILGELRLFEARKDWGLSEVVFQRARERLLRRQALELETAASGDTAEQDLREAERLNREADITRKLREVQSPLALEWFRLSRELFQELSTLSDQEDEERKQAYRDYLTEQGIPIPAGI